MKTVLYTKCSLKKQLYIVLLFYGINTMYSNLQYLECSAGKKYYLKKQPNLGPRCENEAGVDFGPTREQIIFNTLLEHSTHINQQLQLLGRALRL